MICPNCRGAMSDGATRCPKCGQAPGGQASGAGAPGNRKVVAGNLPGVGALGARFEVRSILGEGPLGVVYRVFDREVEVTVAVKVLRSHLFPGDAERQRFLDVCEQARRLSHPNLVRIFHANVDGAYPFYAMQLVEGMSLQQLLSAAPYNPRRFSVSETQVFIEQIVEALTAAHSVVPAHGLLKPANTLLLPDLLKLSDFHLGSVIPPSALGPLHERSPSQRYLAPELRAGQSPTPASDVYSLSCIAVELLTGTAPSDPGNELWGIDLAEDVEALLAEGLAEDPAVRLAAPTEFLRRFRAFAEEGRWAYSPTGGRSAGESRRPTGAPPATLPLASSLSSSPPRTGRPTSDWAAPRGASAPAAAEAPDSILDTLPDDAPAPRVAASGRPAESPPPVDRVTPVVGATHAEERRRRVPIAVWVLLALLVLGGAVYGVIYYMQQFRQEQREELLRLNAAERKRLAQERSELAKLRSDLLSAERRAASAAELAQKRAQEALKAAGTDPKKQAAAKQLAARARRLERRRKKMRARRRAIERKEKAKAEREAALAAKAAKVDEAVASGTAAVSPKSNGDEAAVAKPTLVKPIELASAAAPPVAAPTGAGTELPEVERPVVPPPPPTEPDKAPGSPDPTPQVEKPAVPPTEVPLDLTPKPPPEAPKKAWRPRTVFLRQGMARPKRISGRNPAYTSSAKRAGISGTVVVLFTIKPDGSVHKVRVLKDVPVLGRVCARTVSQWRFSPYQYQGRPVSVIVRQSFEFKL